MMLKKNLLISISFFFPRLLKICLSLSLFLMSSCALFKEDDDSRDPVLRIQKISLILDTDANYTSATEVDLVMVYKHELLKALLKMKAADYYSMAEQLRRDYPEMLKIWHWELTPGQSLNNIPLSVCYEEKGPFGAVLFARYLSPGDHRVRIGSERDIHVLLKREDLCIIEQGCPGGDQVLPSASECKSGCGVTKGPQQTVIALPQKKEEASDLVKETQKSKSLVQKILQQGKKF